jgi:hypothetical protein
VGGGVGAGVGAGVGVVVVVAGGTGGVLAGFLAQPAPATTRVTASDSARMRGLHFISLSS